ncbi:hypothetical protein [Candidatus Contubernalis alkaliaceticus]|uniref:hypothetical protein n=1 Tax=Candidatus Contubernalis alkaliaceticus TaxID=338645 RepID=UPI001F4BE41D|nr:hypothetical protein [Candidatus Contubernalis alkalaceticus]UNC90898.1 hypothetical protein HUE98_01670 [Candidatus Contubernalis alkalaceticus]
MVYVLFLLLAVAIVAIRMLLFKEHKASARLPIFQNHYVQAICTNDLCPINREKYYASDPHNKMLILLHKLALCSQDIDTKRLKCPWCSQQLSFEPLGPLFSSPPPGKELCKMPWEKDN